MSEVKDMTLPRNVFSTCPETNARRKVESTNEYKIFDESGRELMIVKNSINTTDIAKAAKCAKLKTYIITRVRSSKRILPIEFPVKCDVVLRKITLKVPEFKIYQASNEKLLMDVKGPIKKAHLDKAANCAGFGVKYTSWKYAMGTPKLVVTNSSEFKHDVYIRKKIATKTPSTTNFTQKILLKRVTSALSSALYAIKELELTL